MSTCISYKHPEVTKIAGELNISPVVAAAKIGVWQSKNNIEDRFPTVDELQQHNEINYQKNQTNSNEGIIASEKTIRDLAAKIADRIGMKVKFESDRSKDYKGKIENNVAYVNLAYATLDTPIHEILGHPIIRAIKNNTSKTFEVGNYEGGESLGTFNTREEAQEFIKNHPDGDMLGVSSPTTHDNKLYQNLLKELETGKGKEILDRIKRDYTNKTPSFNYSITNEDYTKESIEEINNIRKEKGLPPLKLDYLYKTFSSEEEARDYVRNNKPDDQYNITVVKNEINTGKYSLEEQQEEAIVELLGLMTAEKLDNVKDGKLISLLKRLLKEMKQFIRSLINQKEVEIDKLPDNMTLGDLSDLLAYSNSKLILPGYEVEYTTPDNEKFKTYQEASNHISELAKSVKDVDFSNITVPKGIPDNFTYIDGNGDKHTFNKINENEYEHIYSTPVKNYNRQILDKERYVNTIKQKGIYSFIENNKEYEQSKEIIEEWKKVNNIQYNPEEIYSRGQEFSSVVGAYSDFDVNLMMQNLLSHIEDNEKAGGQFAISAYTKPIDKQIGHLEGGGGKIKFKLYPQSNDILWAANTDVYSGSVWDAPEKVNKDKKSELLGVSYTKYPSLSNVNTVQPNLAAIVDNLNHHHNELGITLTGNNFRLEYDEDIPYTTKKIIDGINKILDQKYGKLVKPEIEVSNKVAYEVRDIDDSDPIDGVKSWKFDNKKDAQEFIDSKPESQQRWFKIFEFKKGIQPTQTNETLKESIDSVRSKFNTEIKDSEISSEESFTQNGWTYTFADWMDGNEKFSKYKFIDGQIKTEYISKESFNQAKKEYLSKGKKEYTSQALINTKIAALKEVAKKQPRSLIRSEVKPINSYNNIDYAPTPDLFDVDEFPFQKIPSVDWSGIISEDVEDMFPDSVLHSTTVKAYFNAKTFEEKLQSLVRPGNENLYSEDYNSSEKTVDNTPQSSEISTSKILFNNRSGNNIKVNEILDNIATNIKGTTTEGKELIEKSKKLISKSGATIKFVSEKEMKKDAIMMWDSATNTILISRTRSFKYTSKDNVIAFLHEVNHSIVAEALLNPQTVTERDFARFVTEFYNKYKDLSDSYGFENKMEFIAELYANKEFRDEVEALSIEKKDNILQKFIDAVRRLIGLKKTSEFDKLIKQVIEFSELDKSSFTGFGENDYGQFAKELNYDKVDLTTLQGRLNNTINKAKDRLDQVLKQAKSNKRGKDNKEFIKKLEELIEEMSNYEELENWKAVISYTKTLSNTVFYLKNSFDKVDINKDTTLQLVKNYENYLATYDLLPEIKKLISTSKKEVLSTEDANLITELKSVIKRFESEHSELVDDFQTTKETQSERFLADPTYNTRIETDNRKRLEKEYKDLKITGEYRDEYVTRMMNTRDKDMITAEYIEAAKGLSNNVHYDISGADALWTDGLNINSNLVQLVMNMVNKTRAAIIDLYDKATISFDKKFEDFVKEKGNKVPSKLYDKQYEQDKDGNYYLRGKYKVEFLQKYREEYSPIKKEMNDLITGYKGQNLTRKEYVKKDEYISLNDKINAWKKENLKKDTSDVLGIRMLPKDSYLNPVLTGQEKVMNDEFIRISQMVNEQTGNKASLINRINSSEVKVMFYKLPSHSKSDFERQIELDFKGLTKDKWTDITKIKADDIGYGEPINGKGDLIRNVKVHYRGKIEHKEQSLDLATMYRAEILNGINYQQKSKSSLEVGLIADIAKNKQYYKKSLKGNFPLLNMFATRQPVQTIEGENSNTYKKIIGIMESNIYDIYSYESNKIGNKDVGKIADSISGYTAKIAMVFNIGSGTANVLNGKASMMIEAFGGNVISGKSLRKAETKYWKDLPNNIADLSNATKKSFSNQVLRMFDTFGGLNPQQQEYIKNTLAKKLTSGDVLNSFNEGGEHMMNSILAMSIIDTLKVMNSDYKFIDTKGNVVSEDKAASLLDMLEMDADGRLQMNPLVKFTKHNMNVEYAQGGNVHVNLLIKRKVGDLFGVYDKPFMAEASKLWYYRALLMFKKFFLPGLQHRYKGLSTAAKSKEDLTEDDLIYSSATKEYEEGTYVTLIRFFMNGIIPTLKGLQASYTSDYYNNMTEFERANLKKATIEIIATSVLLPMFGALLGAAGGDDDDKLWFWLYQTRRLESELSQFRNPIEAARMISNPVAGIRLVQNTLGLTYELLTPLNFVPEQDEHVFSWLDEDREGKNKMGKKIKKVIPIWTQLDKDWQNMYSFINK